ncbi:hypothetical protein JCM3774_005453 [Rhodotorula dairenensis]
MWTRTAARVLAGTRTRTPATRTIASNAAAAAAAAAHPSSVQSTQDALYSHQGPSAVQENVTRPAAFPYHQSLASEQTPHVAVATAPTAAVLEPRPPTTLSTGTGASALPFLDAEPPVPDAPVSRSRRPVGAFRGGIIGFLLGLTAVGGYGYFRVLDDYRQASEKLLVSVEELKSSTEQMTTHLSRISALESNLERLARDAAKTEEVDSLRDESRQLIESHHLDLLNLKAHVWGIEQDLRNLSKRDTAVRI